MLDLREILYYLSMTILIAMWLTKKIPETDLKIGVSYSY